MTWPTFTDYQDAFQHPRVIFADEPLRGGTVIKDANGMPLPASGAMAITFALIGSDGLKYAVRCFQREMPDVESRYSRIDHTIGTLVADSSYFVDFKFQRTGLKIQGNGFPYIRMRWVEGVTLGSYLNASYQNPDAIFQLQQRLRTMADYLGSKGVAHGDIQNLNVMVEPSGALRLIDYDGMFVPGMRPEDASETGLRYFQHPERSPAHFGPKIDRFSFIALDLSLSAVRLDPSLYPRFREGGETVIFKANDFNDPASSPIFNILFANPALKDQALRFATICKGRIEDVPSLAEFSAARSNPAPNWIGGRGSANQKYIPAYEVVDAASFASAEAQFGNRVELVGKIVEVKPGISSRKTPYVFLYFDVQGKRRVRIIFWSEGLSQMNDVPNKSWEGKWISCSGLLADGYPKGRGKFNLISAVIQSQSQLSLLDEDEALYRLGRRAKPHVVPSYPMPNAELREPQPVSRPISNVEKLKAQRPSVAPQQTTAPLPTPQPLATAVGGLTENQKRIQAMKERNRQATAAQLPSPPTTAPRVQQQPIAQPQPAPVPQTQSRGNSSSVSKRRPRSWWERFLGLRS